MSELPAKFWTNTDTWEIIPLGSRSDSHVRAIQADPDRFGLSRSDLAGAEQRDLMTKAFAHGWVRCETEGDQHLNVETTYISDAARVVQHFLDQGEWFTDVFWEFIYTENGTAEAAVHLEGHEQIERFAQRRLLPPRYKDIKMNKRRVPVSVPPQMPAGVPQMSRHIGASMESLIAEARSKVRDKAKVTDVNFDDETSKGELAPVQPKTKRRGPATIPGRMAGAGEARNVRVPVNHATAGAMDALMRQMGDARDAGPGVPEPEQRTPTTLPARTDQVVPINQLPALVGQETGQNLRITWHALTTLPNYVVQQIRAAFRPLFMNMLGADLEEISVATTLPGAGTAGPDLERMWSFLMQRGRVDDSFSLEAFGIDPQQYHVEDAHVVDFGGSKFYLMVENHGGMGRYKYIYVAPGKGQATDQIGHSETPRLTSNVSEAAYRIDKVTIPLETGLNIFLNKDSYEFMQRLPPKHQTPIRAHIRALATNPFPAGIEKMFNDAIDVKMVMYRMRVGKYRVLYGVMRPENKILVFEIGLRKDVYRTLGGSTN